MPKHDDLPVSTFHCNRCGEFSAVYTLGTVIQGPRCPRCHRPMRKVTIIQTELPLFPSKDKLGKNVLK